jgi:hypothetical protein
MSSTERVDTAVPAFHPKLSPSERKADERTRVVREMTDAATEQRSTTTARLKAARLGKEAEDRAQAALEPPKKKGKPKAKG